MRMGTYIARRLLLLIPVIIGVTLLVFALTRMSGDPAAAYITDKMTEHQIQDVYARLHIVTNPTIIDQIQAYLAWLNEVFINFNLGYSKGPGGYQPVSSAMASFFPMTIELTIISMVLSVPLGIWLGTASAVRKDKMADHTTRVASLVGTSIPIFWLGLMLLWIFYFNLNWFPNGGWVSDDFRLAGLPHYTGLPLLDAVLSGNVPLVWDEIWHIALPAITLSFGTIAIITRIMRASMLEVLSQDYIKTARSKGLSEKVVINKHARRNALIPTTTVIGLAFGGLLTGAVLTETIFQWPGIGQWAASAMSRLDSNAIMAFVLVMAMIYVVVNLIVDLLYAYLDPRVRLE